MPRRFNNLDAALKYLRSTSDDTGTTNPDAPAGSQLRLYQDYKAGKRTVTYTRATASKPGAADEVVIKPFGLPAADTDEYLTSVSSRSKAALATAGLSLTDLGASDTLTNGKTIIGFVPARVTVTSQTGTTTTLTDSKLTGRKYNKNTSKVTYTYPFGRTSGNPSYSEQKAAILAAVTASTSRSASFKPEKYV